MGQQAFQSGGRRLFEAPSFGSAVMVLAVVLGVFGTARAENECGQPGASIICSPSNYDAARDGSIIYRLGDAHGGNFTIHLTDDLSIRYDLDNINDDSLLFPEVAPYNGAPLYSAVRIQADADYTGDISLFSSADVVSDGRGISVAHNGRSGALHTEISGGSFSIESEMDVGWQLPHAIHSYRGDNYNTDQKFGGDHDLIIRNISIDSNIDINVSTDQPRTLITGGIVGIQDDEGHLNVDVQDSTIKGNGRWVNGLASAHTGNGHVDMDVQDLTIDVSGISIADGINGYHIGHGKSDVKVQNTDIKVRGDTQSNGITYGYWRDGSIGDLSFDARDVNIDVHGRRNLGGIFGIHMGKGDIDINVHLADIDVVTNSVDSRLSGDSGGIAFVHDSDGDIGIAAQDVDIKVHGDRSVGIGGGQRYQGTGDIDIDVHDSTIVVTGTSVAGIRSFHMSGEGSIHVHVDDGTITAEGADSSGILVGLTGRLLDDRTGPITAPAGGPHWDPSGDGYRPQTVIVNGHVRGGSGIGAGVRLYGGGQVEIGPHGSVSADSGVAVKAEGDEAALHVDVALNRRRPDEAIAGEIRNDDGRTTIEVNGVVLHDGMTGATGLHAPNGARDVSLKASETVKGRVFMLTDFVTAYAPRAAVYEVLPGFMLRLDQGADTAEKRLRIPDSPAWIKVSGGQGSYEPDHSHVGGTYDFDHFGTEVGVEFALSQEQNITGWAALHHVKGSADVAAPTGGGDIDASGFGASAGASWENTAGYYANGSVSLTRYEMDLRSDGWDLLKDGVGATVRTLGIEAGRHFLLADHLSITPQAWLTRSEVSMDDFQDAVESRVSLQEATRSIAGIGVVTERTHTWDGGERTLDLRGRLGIEQVLGDAETVVEVSGERLGSEADRTRVVLGLGAVVHWKRWSLGGEVSASALGSDDNHYTASLRLGTRF